MTLPTQSPKVDVGSRDFVSFFLDQAKDLGLLSQWATSEYLPSLRVFRGHARERIAISRRPLAVACAPCFVFLRAGIFAQQDRFRASNTEPPITRGGATGA